MKYFLFYFLFPFFTISQNSDPSLADLFFKNKTVTWQKQFTGYWDDVIPVRLELASDGESCKGFMIFGDDKNRYVVSGRQLLNELRLEEQDLNSNITGLIVLHLSGENAKGTWYNSKHNFNARLLLKEGKETNPSTYWVKAFAPKADPAESLLIQHKDYSDQISTRFYYKLLNKTLNGTSTLKVDETYANESKLEDYLHHQAGILNSWKINDKRLDIRYKLGNMEYSKTLDLINQLPIAQETFADHWMAVDINYLKAEHTEINAWTKGIIDSFVNNLQNKKRVIIATNRDKKEDRMLYRLSIWPQFDFFNNTMISGFMHIKSSWEENIISIPFNFDLKKGIVLTNAEIIANPVEFKITKETILKKELDKLRSSSALDYMSLSIEDFTMMTIKREGLAFTAPYDLLQGFRQLVIPYYEIRPTLNTNYFPL